MSEREFWTCTIRKLTSLLTIHSEVHGYDADGEAKGKTKNSSKKSETVYIDELGIF